MLVNDDITIGEDAAVVYPLLNECKKIVIANVFGYRYRQREDSMLKKSKPLSEEVGGLRKLYSYLSSFATDDNKFEYQRQINEFILGICIIRFGGIKSNGRVALPFSNDFERKTVAVYSAGTFGQQLVRRIKEYNYCNVISWVDEDYWEYRRCCLDVDPVEALKEKEFDYLLIATVDGEYGKALKSRFVDFGIENNKILCVQCNPDSRELLLRTYLGEVAS